MKSVPIECKVFYPNNILRKFFNVPSKWRKYFSSESKIVFQTNSVLKILVNQVEVLMPKKQKKSSNGNGSVWPQRSPGLCPLDYFYFVNHDNRLVKGKLGKKFNEINEILSYMSGEYYYDAVLKLKMLHVAAKD